MTTSRSPRTNRYESDYDLALAARDGFRDGTVTFDECVAALRAGFGLSKANAEIQARAYAGITTGIPAGHKVCGRCGGSGNYGHHGTCFDCGGRRFVLDEEVSS